MEGGADSVWTATAGAGGAAGLPMPKGNELAPTKEDEPDVAGGAGALAPRAGAAGRGERTDLAAGGAGLFQFGATRGVGSGGGAWFRAT